eukprot:TRINITY_DN13165_c0_g1_i3.p1 TRINITY_DN13165_c0_g1~~TRINITY_DN13165_c0_g1_i3.p1  ORF type:complete len:172 (-),score=28.41 TRINITY_DN13165_c0_g1_i3:159-635(-)
MYVHDELRRTEESLYHAELSDLALALQLEQIEKQEAENRRVQEAADQVFAMKLLLEEKESKEEFSINYNLQEKRDLKLAKRLQKETQETCISNDVDLHNMAVSSRNHALSIHDKFCACSQRETFHNNHIYTIHNQRCKKRSCQTQRYLHATLSSTTLR